MKLRITMLLMVIALVAAACASTDSESTTTAGDTGTTPPTTEADAGEAEPRVFTVGVSWDEKSIPLIQAWEDFAVAEAEVLGPEIGVKFEFIVTVADLDPARQASDIEDLISQEVDLIWARAKDGLAIGTSIAAAEAAGIPFVVFDRKSLAVEQGDAYVGGDSYAQGRATSEGLVAVLEDRGVDGKCIEVLGDLKDNNALLRSDAFAEVAEETGAYEILTQVPTDWEPAKFLSGISSALLANPDANCIYLASDFAWPSVQSALESADRYAPIGDENHIIMATNDLFPDAYLAMVDGYIDVTTTWDAFLQAQELMRVVALIADGKEPQCGEDGCLAPGRQIFPKTLDSTLNLWSRDAAMDDG